MKTRKVSNKEEHCAGIAMLNSGRVFLIRPLYKNIVQQYAFPKGHVEDGENIEDAAKREFKEETGIDIFDKKMDFLGTVSLNVDNGSKKYVHIYTVFGNGDETFIGSIASDDGLPECIGGDYIDFNRAMELITPYQQPLIQKIIDKYKTGFKSYIVEKFLK